MQGFLGKPGKTTIGSTMRRLEWDGSHAGGGGGMQSYRGSDTGAKLSS